MKKWDTIDELTRILDAGWFDPDIEIISHAPQIANNCWICKYRGVYAAILEFGEGHYTYYSSVSRIDVLLSKIYSRFPEFLKEVS